MTYGIENWKLGGIRHSRVHLTAEWNYPVLIILIWGNELLLVTVHAFDTRSGEPAPK